MMPGMDASSYAASFAHAALCRDADLILSTRSDSESVIRGMEAGATGYLPKPILHHDLVSKVRSMLNLSTVER
jgi:DNA-binding NarL/FixJ family response regulator